MTVTLRANQDGGVVLPQAEWRRSAILGQPQCLELELDGAMGALHL
jgi:hypothetical protein